MLKRITYYQKTYKSGSVTDKISNLNKREFKFHLRNVNYVKYYR